MLVMFGGGAGGGGGCICGESFTETNAVCLVLNTPLGTSHLSFQPGFRVAPHSGYISITDVVVLNCTVIQT